MTSATKTATVAKKTATGAKFTPLADRVVVKLLDNKKEEIRGGIIIPDTAKEKPQEGEIVAVGLGRVTDDGKRIAMELKTGDHVIYAKYGGTEIKEDGQDYLILRESDILAKYN